MSSRRDESHNILSSGVPRLINHQSSGEPRPQEPFLGRGVSPQQQGCRALKKDIQDQNQTSATGLKVVKHISPHRLEKVYVRRQLLGSGGYGSVYAGVRKSDGLPVAIKYVSMVQADKQLNIPGLGGTLPREVALMMQVCSEPVCPNIVRLLDWYKEPESYIMVLERPESSKDLRAFCNDLGGYLSEELARRIITQLLVALTHCREKGVFHRDIKPENLLIHIKSHLVKLIDFGCGDVLKDTTYEKFPGTTRYMPPEWFIQRQYLAEPATVWSMGVTLYRLVCGVLPFKTIKKSTYGRVTFRKNISAEYRHLVCWCLSINEMDRPTLEQIQGHNWLKRKQPTSIRSIKVSNLTEKHRK